METAGRVDHGTALDRPTLVLQVLTDQAGSLRISHHLRVVNHLPLKLPSLQSMRLKRRRLQPPFQAEST
jgi:hypothetical protein